MYRVGVTTELEARHFLFGADFGPEGEEHAHTYRVEVTLAGERLDAHGFLVDIDRVRAALAAQRARLHGARLNDLPELAGLNPSVERLAELIAGALARELDLAELAGLTVQVWETGEAWASYTRER